MSPRASCWRELSPSRELGRIDIPFIMELNKRVRLISVGKFLIEERIVSNS